MVIAAEEAVAGGWGGDQLPRWRKRGATMLVAVMVMMVVVGMVAVVVTLSEMVLVAEMLLHSVSVTIMAMVMGMVTEIMPVSCAAAVEKALRKILLDILAGDKIRPSPVPPGAAGATSAEGKTKSHQTRRTREDGETLLAAMAETRMAVEGGGNKASPGVRDGLPLLGSQLHSVTEAGKEADKETKGMEEEVESGRKGEEEEKNEGRGEEEEEGEGEEEPQGEGRKRGVNRRSVSFAEPLAETSPEPSAELSSGFSSEPPEDFSAERFASSRRKRNAGGKRKQTEEKEEKEEPLSPPPPPPPQSLTGKERERERERRPSSASARFLLDGCCVLLRIFGRAALLVVGVLEAKIVWTPLGDEMWRSPSDASLACAHIVARLEGALSLPYRMRRCWRERHKPAELRVDGLFGLSQWLFGVAADASFGLVACVLLLRHTGAAVRCAHRALHLLHVDVLRDELEWLNYFPAGFKLNVPLTHTLGSLTLVGMEAYASVVGKLAPWELFRGRKRNVLRRRVDTCMYDACQLLLGTLVFTVLSFLTPTVSVYYTFFCIVQAVAVGGQVLDAPLPSAGRVPFRRSNAEEDNSEEGDETGGGGFRRNQAASSLRARGDVEGRANMVYFQLER
eukprot:jgi/Undpi1/4347/HiC_scaffold_17.g07713.m1